MTLIVEDGTGRVDAESYASVATCGTYCANRGMTFDTTQTALCEQALRRATAYIDQRYRRRFPGYRVYRATIGSYQALEWPRLEAYYHTPDDQGDGPYLYGFQAYGNLGFEVIPQNAVPVEVINATCEAAAREFAEPGQLFPDLDRGGGVAELVAGSVRIGYAGNAANQTTFQAIDYALSRLIGYRSQYTAKAVRG